jgi:hypothetical protein
LATLYFATPTRCLSAKFASFLHLLQIPPAMFLQTFANMSVVSACVSRGRETNLNVLWNQIIFPSTKVRMSSFILIGLMLQHSRPNCKSSSHWPVRPVHFINICTLISKCIIFPPLLISFGICNLYSNVFIHETKDHSTLSASVTTFNLP